MAPERRSNSSGGTSNASSHRPWLGRLYSVAAWRFLTRMSTRYALRGPRINSETCGNAAPNVALLNRA
jgi:hypothetical protein